MQPAANATVFIVDDDAGVRDALAWLLRTRRLHSETFDSAEAFAAMLALRTARGGPVLREAGCLLLDVRMPGGMSGLALFDQLSVQGLRNALPVIFLTGHADVATAVDAVKRGAFDFCEKPFSDNALVDRVEQALNLSAATLARHAERDRLRARMAELTERERDVMQRVAQGLPNKLIADALDISVRTVEVHRARVFEKMGVKSAVDLVHLLQEL